MKITKFCGGTNVLEGYMEWKEWTSQGCWMVEGHYKGVRAG